eukprot:225033-Amphidinium_carterae.2
MPKRVMQPVESSTGKTAKSERASDNAVQVTVHPYGNAKIAFHDAVAGVPLWQLQVQHNGRGSLSFNFLKVLRSSLATFGTANYEYH